MPRKSVSTIYQLKVTLRDAKPPIWRRIQVPGTISMYELHLVIQAIMPWSNSHLFEFEAGETNYGEPDPDDRSFGHVVKNARRAKLSQVLFDVKDKMSYLYDFGDGWEHDVVVEKITSPESGIKYPVCLTGRRAAPPDDVGGIWGYADFVEAIQNPDHEEHDSMLEWVGGEFDPARFDLAEANAALEEFR